MAKKVTKKKQAAKAKQVTKKERIVVPTAPIMDAVDAMVAKVNRVKLKIEALPKERQQVEPNKSSLERALRSLSQLQAMQLIVDAAVCCDVQIQNCEFEIES
jgi:hypothetical protein